MLINKKTLQLFISSLLFALFNTSNAADHLVAAGLKGMYNNLPPEIQAISPIHGAVMATNGDLAKLYHSEKQGPLEKLANLMFHELDDKMRCTVLTSNPVSVLNQELMVEIFNALQTNSLSKTLLFDTQRQPTKKDPLSEKDLSSFGNHWFTLMNNWKNKHTKNKKSHNFFKGAPAFLETLNEAFQINPQLTQYLLLAFVYLKCKTPHELQAFFKQLYPQAQEGFFTEDDYESYQTVFLETDIKQEDLPNYVEQLCFFFLQYQVGNLSFLQAPLRYSLHEEQEFPTCVEDSLQTIVNCLLYDEKTNRLSLLKAPSQKTINPKFKAFIEKHNDLSMKDYYTLTLPEWMDLVSNVPHVTYLQETSEVKPSIENIFILLSFLFGITIEKVSDMKIFENITKDNEDESEEEDDDDKSEDDSQLFLTFDNLSPDGPVTLEIEFDNIENHSKTEFRSFKKLEFSSEFLTSVEHIEKLLGQNLIPLITKKPYDIIPSLIDYEGNNLTKAQFKHFLDYLKITNEEIMTSHSVSYLIDDLMNEGRKEFLEVLVERGIDIVKTPTTPYASTLLRSLVEVRSIRAKIPEYLLELGAPALTPQEANTLTRDGESLLDILLSINSDENDVTHLLKLLLKWGASTEDISLERVITDDKASYKALKLLLQYGANPDALIYENDLFYTPLQYALTKGNKKIAKLLLEYDADPTIKSHTNKTGFDYIKIFAPELMDAALQNKKNILQQRQDGKVQDDELYGKLQQTKPINPHYDYRLNRYEAEYANQIENELQLLRSIEDNYPVFEEEYRAKRPAYDDDKQ